MVKFIFADSIKHKTELPLWPFQLSPAWCPKSDCLLWPQQYMQKSQKKIKQFHTLVSEIDSLWTWIFNFSTSLSCGENTKKIKSFFLNVQQILGHVHCLKVVRIHFGLPVEILKTMIKQNDHCLNIKNNLDRKKLPHPPSAS